MQASWFNRTTNYKEASEAALMAKRDVLGLLTSDKTWRQLRLGQDSSRLHTEMQAEDMFRAAKLCAVLRRQAGR